jgi:hypothetical protein
LAAPSVAICGCGTLWANGEKPLRKLIASNPMTLDVLSDLLLQATAFGDLRNECNVSANYGEDLWSIRIHLTGDFCNRLRLKDRFAVVQTRPC